MTPFRQVANPRAAKKRRLACPFHQAFKAHHRRGDSPPQHSCSGMGFPDLPRLVDHLKRHHTAKSDSDKPDFGHTITQETLEKIQQLPRKRLRESRADKWGKIYKLIFGDDSNTPDAFQAQGVEHIIRISQNPPRRVREVMQQELNSNNSTRDCRPLNVSDFLRAIPVFLRLIDSAETTSDLVGSQAPYVQSPAPEVSLTARSEDTLMAETTLNGVDEDWEGELMVSPSDVWNIPYTP